MLQFNLLLYHYVCVAYSFVINISKLDVELNLKCVWISSNWW